jgi:hypothetical protein
MGDGSAGRRPWTARTETRIDPRRAGRCRGAMLGFTHRADAMLDALRLQPPPLKAPPPILT